MTEQQAKSILFKMGIKFGVSPALISTRLLSADDKKDMLNDDVPMNTLETAIQCWIDAEMPDYANGSDKPYKDFSVKQ